MAFTYVAATAGQATFTTATTAVCSYSSTGPSANSLLICAVFLDHATTSPAQVVTNVTDSRHNRWLQADAGTLGSTQFLDAEIWYCQSNLVGGPNTVSINLSGAVTAGHIIVSEYTTGSSGAALNVHGNATNTTASATSFAIGTSGSAASGDLVVATAGLHGTANTLGNSSGYNNRAQYTSGTANASFYDLLSATAATQTCTATFTSHRYEAGAIATFTAQPASAIVERPDLAPDWVLSDSPLVTDPFSVPGGSVVVAQVCGFPANSASTPTATITDSGSHTWNTAVTNSRGGDNGTTSWGDLAGIYWAYFANYAGNITVTASCSNTDTSGTQNGLLSIMILTNASSTQTGATSTTNHDLTAQSTGGTTSITTTTAGSTVLGVSMNSTSPSGGFSNNGTIPTGFNGQYTILVNWMARKFTGTPGATTLGVTYPEADSSYIAAKEFLPQSSSVPTVASISPSSGPEGGGTSVVITGTNFTGVTGVTFGGTNASTYTVNSTTQITATDPGTIGTVDVRVTNASGTSSTSNAARFSRWLNRVPAIYDDFSGTAIDTTQWDLYNGTGNNGNGLRIPGQVSVANSVATIVMDTLGNTGGFSGHQTQAYGVWEARIKASRADNELHPTLIVWPYDDVWPAHGEVDFFECGDGTRQTTSGYLHYDPTNLQTATEGFVADITHWQIFRVIWTPRSITYQCNGVQWFQDTTLSHLPPGPMIITVQLDWDTGGVISQGGTMDIDWIRIYDGQQGANFLF